ncbi:MAG: 50S ribosomal protein L27 [Patescibacteria group bacterium]
MAHTKALGSTKLGRDSESKRLGVKIQDGQVIKVGEIIIRQRGSKYAEGTNVKRGGDDTLYAMKTGKVAFSTKHKINFDGTKRQVKVVSVV